MLNNESIKKNFYIIQMIASFMTPRDLIMSLRSICVAYNKWFKKTDKWLNWFGLQSYANCQYSGFLLMLCDLLEICCQKEGRTEDDFVLRLCTLLHDYKANKANSVGASFLMAFIKGDSLQYLLRLYELAVGEGFLFFRSSDCYYQYYSGPQKVCLKKTRVVGYEIHQYYDTFSLHRKGERPIIVVNQGLALDIFRPPMFFLSQHLLQTPLHYCLDPSHWRNPTLDLQKNLEQPLEVDIIRAVLLQTLRGGGVARLTQCIAQFNFFGEQWRSILYSKLQYRLVMLVDSVDAVASLWGCLAAMDQNALAVALAKQNKWLTLINTHQDWCCIAKTKLHENPVFWRYAYKAIKFMASMDYCKALLSCGNLPPVLQSLLRILYQKQRAILAFNSRKNKGAVGIHLAVSSEKQHKEELAFLCQWIDFIFQHLTLPLFRESALQELFVKVLQPKQRCHPTIGNESKHSLLLR